MEKRSTTFNPTITSCVDGNSNPDFHYSIHDNSMLCTQKKPRKSVNRKVNMQTSNCGVCLTSSPRSNSPSFVTKITSIFCCYLPSHRQNPKKQRLPEKLNQDPKKVESPKTGQTIGLNDQAQEVSVVDQSEEKDYGSEINWFESSKKSPTIISRANKCSKPGTGSMQSRCPFLKKTFVSTKLSQFPENELFFWKSNESFVIARIKCNEFFTDNVEEKNTEKEGSKLKAFAKMAFNSLAQNQKKHVLKDNLSSLDAIKPRNKYSIINLAEETKHETKENLTYDERFRDSRPKLQNIFLRNQNIIEKKIKIDTESWDFTIPDKISDYLAKRCRKSGAETVLDAYCGIGMNAIRFFQEDFKVIAMDSRIIEASHKRSPAVDYALYNANLQGVNDQINFIYGEFLEMNLARKMLDVILINPVLKQCPEKKFSLLKNAPFDYHGVLRKALSLVPNVVLCLPRSVEILEIVELFSSVFNEIEEVEANCIEVEFQFINKELQQIVVFYGPVAEIARKEIIEFLMTYVNKDNKTCKMRQNNFVQSIFQRIGIKSSARCIVSAEAKQGKAETILQRFIDLVKINRELSLEDLDECRKETANLESKEIIGLEDMLRDMALREQSLLLNLGDDSKEKKKYQKPEPHSKLYELSFDSYLEVHRSKKLNHQEAIHETPTYSFYSGKLMSSVDGREIQNFPSMREKETKELMKELPNGGYSFQQSLRGRNLEKEKLKENSERMEEFGKQKRQKLEFWEDDKMYETGLVKQSSDEKKNEGKFEDFRCKFFEFV